jgi:hypothetical protein
MEYEDTAPEQPGASRPWLQMIEDARKAFQVYDDKCASIEKQFANLKSMAEAVGDREFQIFWANMETLKPAIYTRPPRPVVMPRHSDLGEVVRKASEMLERALQFDIEEDDVHDTMIEVRNDLAMNARGVPWVLDNGQCIHVLRCDFLHEPARKWKEVGWVARRAYVTREDGVERFGDMFYDAECNELGRKREDDYRESEKKAEVWEIWSKTDNKVVWVAEGVDEVLEESDPLIDVKGFFPCPKPAYGTLEPGTLLPVPDFVYYRDQVDEINELTARISALSESLRLKGFYAAGTSEIGEAIEAAMRQTDNKAILVPISNFAALGGQNLKDSIVWLPVEEVANIIVALVALRKQLIEDVYEITGLSDIMRGATEAQETLGAQRLKAQYGSVRVTDRQSEMVRVALDVIRIKAEIYAEMLPGVELMQMAAMSLPTDAQVKEAMAQADPQAAQAVKQPVTIEQVDRLLKSQRVRPFLMEIETDSTIAPDEQAEKESRIEFITAVGGFMQQTYPIIANAPEVAPFAGEMLRFVAGGFRAGRDMGGAIDDLIEAVTAKAEGAQQGQQPPDPEAIKAQVEAQRMQMETQKFQTEMQIKQAELQLRQQEIAAKTQREAMDSETRAYDAKTRAAIKQFELALKAEELGIKQDESALKAQQAEIQALLDVEELALEKKQQRAVKIGSDG